MKKLKRLLAPGVFFVGFSSCLAPTEIVLQLSTDVDCSYVEGNGVAIAVGPAGVDTNYPNTTTHGCVDGGVGTLVVLPSAATGPVGIRVTLGIDASVESCNAGDDFAGCIVARRALEYDPHQPLTLPIELQRACIGKVCDPTSTCFDGQCVDASVPCDGASCGAPSVTCTPTATLKIATNAAGFTPHIAATSQGYVVAWMDAKGLEVELVAPDGSNVRGPVVIGNPTSIVKTGPVGTDGTNIVALIDEGNGAAEILSGSLSGAGGPGQPSTSRTILPDDVLSGPKIQAYMSWNMTTGVFDLAGSIAPVGATGPTATSATGFGIAQSGTTTFLAASSGTACEVAACDPATLACNASLYVGPITCTGVRFAPGPTASQWAVAAVSASYGVDFVVQTGAGPTHLPPPQKLDDQAAFIPVVTSSAFHALYRTSDVIHVLTYQAVPLDSLFDGMSSYYSTETTAGGAGFDLVADDPATSNGYAVVYWAWDHSANNPPTGTINFARACD